MIVLFIIVIIVLIVVCIGFFVGRDKFLCILVEEWFVGGRCFGGFFVWFLVGVDFYMVYIFLGLISIVFIGGSVVFFVIFYFVLVYFIVYFFLLKFWKVVKIYKLIIFVDYVWECFDSKFLVSFVVIVGVFMFILYICF